MLLRAITAAILIPVVVALVWWAPLALLTAAAAVVAILAMNELFQIGERMGMRPFRKWSICAAAAIFYSQYSMSLVETHALSGGVSIVRDAASGVISLEIVFLIYFLGAVAIASFRNGRCRKFCRRYRLVPRDYFSLCGPLAISSGSSNLKMEARS